MPAGAHLLTDAAVAGLDYGDRLVYLEAPEDFQKRTELWNEVKAAPI
jgi:hypothetical protein